MTTEQYKRQVTSPTNGFEWQLAFADTLTEIGKTRFALLRKKVWEEEEIEEFIEQLTFLTFVEQKRAEEQLQRDIEDQEEHTRERLLQAWARAQLKEIKTEDASLLASPLAQEIFVLLQAVATLTLNMRHLVAQQIKLQHAWQTLHEVHIEHVIKQLQTEETLSPEKQKEIREALIPAAPALVFKLNPHLAKRLTENSNGNEPEPAEANEASVDPVFLNMAKMNQLITELTLSAMLNPNLKPGERLMGAALLAEIKYRQPQFNRLHLAADPLPQAVILQDSAKNYQLQQQAEKRFDTLESAIKDKMQELHPSHRFAPMPSSSPAPKPTSSGSKRNDEEENNLSYRPR